MGNLIDKKLLGSFQKVFDNPNATKDFLLYYITLSTWVKQNIEYFDEDVLKSNRLDVLLKLEPKEYIVDDPEILLDMEKERIGKREFETIDNLAMSIGDTLWDLVTIKSGKDCPNCIDDVFRYLIAENLITKDRKVILECETCGWTEKMDGSEWDEGIVNVVPANKSDLEKYGVII